MHFSNWEKVGFAVLLAAWVIWGTNKIGNTLVHAHELKENAFKIEGVEKAESGKADKAEAAVPFGQLLASASAEAGAAVFKKCASCHTTEKGGANKVGPNLWGVVGGKLAGHDGFKYSSALSGVGGQWSYENLDKFLASPAAFAKGTKMTFAGLKKGSERANVILYLRQHHDNPPPLP
ncbi:MAG: cytochrome c family protein [Proteobacteria bacterium]|nr:cytochrome c family protein [Pseudomonadota bacterium]